jgi:SH3-like domain-containing protein
MAQRNSLRPSGLVAGVLAALASMFHRGRPVLINDPRTLRDRDGGINWLKGSLISGKTAPGARGG